MRKTRKHSYTAIFLATLIFMGLLLFSKGPILRAAPFLSYIAPSDSSDEIKLKYPLEVPSNNPKLDKKKSGLLLKDPKNIKSGFEFDPETETYNYYEKIGDDIDYANPTYMDFEEYIDYDSDQALKKYWKQKAAAEDLNQTSGFRPQLVVRSKAFDRIFGGNTIDIRPQGSAELIFGIKHTRTDNPALTVDQQRITDFDFDQKIQLNVIGKIGEKMKLTTSYNTEATFSFLENKMKINYEGEEDDILQKLEAGDVSLPLNSSLITGSQTLFGIKTKLQFGKLSVTTVLSQERGEKKQIQVQGGAQIQTFEKEGAEYEENKHYFLSQYFRDTYERSLSTLPIINSRARINKVEVWITNTNNTTNNTRNIIGFIDLGEATTQNIYNNTLVTDQAPTIDFPYNEGNSLYPNITGGYASSASIRAFNNANQSLAAIGYVNGDDFEKYENARLLSSQEYTINEQLGYISLNSRLNTDEILAVSFQYTLDGNTYQVGEFSTDGVAGQDALFVKLLKGTNINTQLPTWDLMMKNVYSIGAYNVSAQDFSLDLWYLNPATGVQIPFIPEGNVNGKPLIQVMNLDNLNSLNQNQADGIFDYLENITISPKNGRIYFPVLEPFGDHLRSQFSDPILAEKFTYDSLYHTTQPLAKQDANKNRFIIKGQYSSSVSSDISLNAFNIPQGSVNVTAGGATLTENVDYTVDYNLGRVKIINEGILQSGTPIKIDLQSNSLFNIQTKTLIGSRFDYKLSKDINLGATILNLSERPLTQKISIGDEPISNTIWGVDGTYTSEAPFLTRWVDKLPIYSTKEKSTFTAEGEFAHLIPGNARAIGKSGTAYLDDFEGSQSTIDLKSFSRWKMASTPQGQPLLFPEANFPQDTIIYGFNRAKIAWYIIDPIFWGTKNDNPDHIKNDPDMTSHQYMRRVDQKEVFPFREIQQQQVNSNLPTLDLAFYPEERGPYNFDDGSTPYGAGLNSNGDLNNPSTRWGGIMRKLETTDFESSNIEFIQFWMMDPFDADDGDPTASGGDLYINLGNISEDILKDSRKSFENGLPTTSTLINVDTTIWGRVPSVQAIVNAFDNNPATRPFQDVGLDGLNDADENSFFTDFISTYGTTVQNDPSADNYHYYRGSDYDSQELNILERYKKFNGFDGNSPTQQQYPESYPSAASVIPDNEDINLNNNLDFRESYYQYQIKITPGDLATANIGENYITDILETTVNASSATGNTVTKKVKWYQFKIPVKQPDATIGNIEGYKNIRFMRMFMKGFSKPVVLRFAKIDLIRGDWRRYEQSLLGPGDYLGTDNDDTRFIISAVNLEENSQKKPVNYVIPPDIIREINPNPSSGTQQTQLNEQALVLDVCNLADGDARAGFKTLDMDLRQYGKIKLFVHAEENNPDYPLNDNDVSLILRMGTDYVSNYYEYEVPLKVTEAGFYDKDSEADQKIVWPEINNIELAFDLLLAAKVERNKAIANGTGEADFVKPFEVKDGNNIIRIKGNPNLANVKTVMLGVKNPKQNPQDNNDDGFAKCAEVWVNELRMTDFTNNGGWASQVRTTTQLADLGSVNVSGDYSTPGFGSLEQKLNERQQEIKRQYDLSTNIDASKLVPEKVGISLPVYYNISEGKVTPKFNPLDPDLELQDVLNDQNFSEQYRDSIGRRTEAYTKRRSITFTNVRKLKSPTKKKSHFYDLSNLSFNYAYTEQFYRDINVDHDLKKTHRGGFTYIYNTKSKPIEPFKKSKIFKSKAFKIIKDFNFNPVPKQFSFQTDIDRMYSERQNRNNTGYDFDLPSYYQRHFYWNRTYNLKHDITKALKFDFSATNNATIYEPLVAGGRVDNQYKDEYQLWKDTVMQSIQSFGTNMQYHHQFKINYKLPLNKIPVLSFLDVTTSYGGDYDWKRAPIGADSTGNVIQNSNTLSVNARMSMTKLHNQSKFLKAVKKRAQDRKRKRKQSKNKKKLEKKKAEQKKKLEEKKKALQKAGKLPPALANKGEEGKPKEDKDQKAKKDTTKKPLHLLDPLGHLIMTLKNVSGTYTKNRGTLLPGYRFDNSLLGYNSSFSAPGFNFVSGIQEDDFAVRADERDWLVDRNSLMYNYNNTFSENYNVRATINPLKTFRIQLNATRNYAEDIVQQFFWSDSASFENNIPVEGYKFPIPQINGNFSMSYLSFSSAFEKDEDITYISETFKNLLANRQQISQSLGQENENSNGTVDGYADGYGPTSQDVIISSFVSAYSGRPANTKSFKQYIPLPNWRITFDGLSRIPSIRKYVRKISLSHSYKSTFNVSSFTGNLLYQDNQGGYAGDAFSRDLNNNFIPRLQVATVSINEQFSPLIGANITLKNNMTVKFNYKRDRNVSLSLANNQITEIKGSEITVGTGYKFKQVRFPFIEKEIRSDLEVRGDLSMRDNITIIRKIVEETNVPSAGQKVFSLKLTGDYAINSKFNIRVFFDQLITTPVISNTGFPTSTSNGGVSLRFTLTQ